ncbi:SDR family oxidoreductase [Paludisphaera mucosa]|uniref:dTDP-4-dehydrorhamnose reductase n=1 Tax=Paludisphaera mucosa TaxID=3030827 RepID=A0ABT6F7K8_9BACT|nr:SDR family oxidoreductase [Paludisphaera mucosa]MDG3003512.1 SDR family oxidoreductase [Paludisphaera mucosa]
MSSQLHVARPELLATREGTAAERLKAVVVGGSGQIGGWLLRHLAARGHESVGTYSTRAYPGLIPLDAADGDAADRLIREKKPDVVFYPAGFTWVDGCERDRAKAYRANLEQPMAVARSAAAGGARFVYFSTDYVFDGVSGPYGEDAATNPLSVYAQAKFDAEGALAEALGGRLLTVRTCWVFGPERQGKNYAYQLIRNLSHGKTMTCPSDQISSPSYGPDVAKAVLALVEAGASGLVNVVGPEVMNRVAFSRSIASAFGLDEDLILGKPTAEIGQGAPRPLNSGLLIDRLESKLPGIMRPLDETLADFRAKLDDPALQTWVEPAIVWP